MAKIIKVYRSIVRLKKHFLALVSQSQEKYKIVKLNFLHKSFTLLDHKTDRYLIIAIIFAFSVLFINTFEPWNIGRWYSDSGLIEFMRLSSYGLVVTLVLLFTQFPLRKFFKQQQFTVITFSLWFIIEISLISLVYILLYGNLIGNFLNDFFFSIRYTLLGVILPYSFALLIINFKNQRREIAGLKRKLALPAQKKLIGFFDDKGNLKFSLLPKDILLLEASDNYVVIHYMSEEKVRRELLRNTMKTMEEDLKQSAIIRCHRSFMVNPEKIEYLKKTGKKRWLKIHKIEEQIPVSEKYSSLYSDFLPPERKFHHKIHRSAT